MVEGSDSLIETSSFDQTVFERHKYLEGSHILRGPSFDGYLSSSSKDIHNPSMPYPSTPIITQPLCLATHTQSNQQPSRLTTSNERVYTRSFDRFTNYYKFSIK
ncbi:hypothetical protein HanPI659440_Chr02g0088051 [Helianthus annuus]|nr:hypothetical protein HanPI659440_Chr02g0088051 [Helianthus annuus]